MLILAACLVSAAEEKVEGVEVTTHYVTAVVDNLITNPDFIY
jgi:hypothetical protein